MGAPKRNSQYEDLHVVWVNESNKHDYKDYYNVITIPEAFEDYYDDLNPYQIWKGSRFSAKSYTKALFSLLHCHFDDYYRMIFARKTQKAARESQFQLFLDIFIDFPILKTLFEVKDSKMQIISKRTGNFIKGGSFEDSDSLMSVPNITDFWAEEPITHDGSIKRQDFLSIAGTLRNNQNIVPRFHFTFNPIGMNNFIYEDFFEQNLYDGELTVVHVNYDQNPYCPKDRIDFLNRLKVVDPGRYNVDGLGKWGELKNDSPFFRNFKKQLHYTACQKPRLDTTLEFSFDFNVGSCYAIMYQFIVAPIKKGGGFNVYKTFKGKDTRDVCRLIKDYMKWNKTGAVWDGVRNVSVTGDATGKNASATGHNINNYTIIKDELSLSNQHLVDVSGANARHVHSMTLCNDVLAQIPVRIHNKKGFNEDLVFDLEVARFDDATKSLVKDRKEHTQDAGDTFRYAINKTFPDSINSVLDYAAIIAPNYLGDFDLVA